MARGGPPNGMKVVPSWRRFSTCRVETHVDPLSASCYNRDFQRSGYANLRNLTLDKFNGSRTAAYLDRIVTRLTAIEQNLSTAVTDFKREVESASRLLELIENRLDRLDTRQTGMDITLSGVSNSMAREGKIASAAAAAQPTQQRTLNDLAARLRRLEDERKAS
jgi:hypothetical protein